MFLRQVKVNSAIGDCREGEVLHLREPLEGADYELAPGYYVLREVITSSQNGGIVYIAFGVVSQAGEDEDGSLTADGETHLLPGYALHAFAGIGIRINKRRVVLTGSPVPQFSTRSHF